MFMRRIGPGDTEAVHSCFRTYGCPDIWEMADGDFAIIGTDITESMATLPPSAGCAPTERMVKVPRRLLVQAKPYIPDTI